MEGERGEVKERRKEKKGRETSETNRRCNCVLDI